MQTCFRQEGMLKRSKDTRMKNTASSMVTKGIHMRARRPIFEDLITFRP